MDAYRSVFAAQRNTSTETHQTDFCQASRRTCRTEAIMPKSYKSKASVTAFLFCTVSVIGSIVTLIVLFRNQIFTMNQGPASLHRLPKNLIPESYNIFLQPHLFSRVIDVVNVTAPNQTMLFTGNSTVNFHCVQRTSIIYLHSEDLAVSNPAVVDRDSDEVIGVYSVKYHTESSSLLEIQLDEALEAGRNYSLFLAFKGEISETLQGLYVSKYNEGLPDDERDSER